MPRLRGRRPGRPIRIPDEIKPADGRFGSGPSKVRPEAVDALRAVATRTSAPPTGSARCGTRWPGCAAVWPPCSTCRTGYEVMLGVGGATAFWDVAVFGLVRNWAQCARSVSSAPSSPRR